MSRVRLSLYRRVAAVSLAVPMGCAPALQAQTQWQTVEPSPLGTTTVNSWKPVPRQDAPANAQIWEPLSPEEELLEPDQLVWTEPTVDQDASDEIDAVIAADKESNEDKSNQETVEEGFRWPNGQLMSEADQIYYRTAYSRGSMIQIGDTVYPHIGLSALQSHPNNWVNFGISAIDDSWQSRPSPCDRGDFLDRCADGLMDNTIRLWRSDWFSLDLRWTIHSLSGEGSPFSFTVNETVFGSADSGTAFGEGQSLGLRFSKNLGETFGLSLGGNRLFHLDETTDLTKPFYLMGTKVFRLRDTLEPPIIVLTAGLMSDLYNPNTNIGKIKYPSWLRGGLYPSTFSEKYDGKNKTKRGYYPNVAGVSSQWVCAERTIFKGIQPTASNNDCIHDVTIQPVGSIGFAPWPWLGMYAKFTRNLNLGVSIKPFNQFNWNISLEAVSPIPGLNDQYDRMIETVRCPEGDGWFKECRTRVAIWSELSF
ncbi:hypothetical protein SynA18461_00465 [Synechococcus sp. A18-46.1]|nr:hypothetical protein SynA18461_00465 [Synechococcus sp. A18-46.1]